MNLIASFLVAAGLSMDNLAVTVPAGCSGGRCLARRFVWGVSALFAVAHFGMFAFGFEGGIWMHAGRTLGPWIACTILVVIGVRMVKSAFEPHPVQSGVLSTWQSQCALAVATSLDALFVGAGLALAGAPFWQTQAALVLCVFVTSLCGFYLGRYLGQQFGRKMEIAGGAVLVFLGVKVLLEGVGIW